MNDEWDGGDGIEVLVRLKSKQREYLCVHQKSDVGEILLLAFDACLIADDVAKPTLRGIFS